jgi:hypothetical protein
MEFLGLERLRKRSSSGERGVEIGAGVEVVAREVELRELGGERTAEKHWPAHSHRGYRLPLA